MPKTHQTASALLTPGKGIFVADEYVGEMFDGRGSQPPDITFAQYVDLVLAAPGVEDSLSGVVLTADTFAASGHRLDHPANQPQAVQLGVRMDAELARLKPGEEQREAVEKARRQLAANRMAGATFVEWRANLSPANIERGGSHVEAEALSRGAAASQAEEILPLVTVAMPDLASHSAVVTQAATGNALDELFNWLARSQVDTSAMLLSINMVLAGDRGPPQTPPDDVARATLRVISKSVPNDVPGVVFLSGGQPLDQACANLSTITSLARQLELPQRFTFGYARALVAGTLEAWPDAEVVQRAFVAACRRAGQPVSSASAPSP